MVFKLVRIVYARRQWLDASRSSLAKLFAGYVLANDQRPATIDQRPLMLRPSRYQLQCVREQIYYGFQGFDGSGWTAG